MITINKVYDYLDYKKTFKDYNSFRIIKVSEMEFSIMITYEHIVNERLLSSVYFINKRSYNTWFKSNRKEKLKILNTLLINQNLNIS